MTNAVCVSSNINEVIRAVLNFLFLFMKIFFKHKKAQKSTKNHKNATKQKYKTQISEQK